MADYKEYQIAEGVNLVAVQADRFKSNKVSISFALDLNEKTASRNAVAISILSSCSKEYPDITAINKKLALLYGASLFSNVKKTGDAQILSLLLSTLDDRFGLDGDISTEGLKMMLSLLFNPRLDENGDFYKEDIEREKLMLKQSLQAEFNDKKTYALNRTEQIMFKNEPFAVNPYGSIEAIDKVTSSDIKQALKQMLENAKIQITVVGNANIDFIKSELENAFSTINRDYKPLSENIIVRKAQEVKDISERMDVKQGKLVLGYRLDFVPDDTNYVAMRAFCDAFGGGPYSKLFANVREKLSLCYYCSARYIKQKSAIIIQCGCEEENMDKAIAEIDNQLKSVIAGDFEQEFNASKIGLSDLIRSCKDDVDALSIWYLNHCASKSIISPDESARQNDEAKLQDAVSCASLLSLDTVYRLLSNKE